MGISNEGSKMSSEIGSFLTIEGLMENISIQHRRKASCPKLAASALEGATKSRFRKNKMTNQRKKEN